MKKTLINHFPFYFLCFLFALIPFNLRLIGPVMILWVLASIVSKQKGYVVRFSKYKNIYASLIVFYLIHIIGLLWSENIDFGLKDLEYKLSIIIVPFIIPFYNYSSKNVKIIFSVFILSCLLTSVLSLYLNFDVFINTGNLLPSKMVGFLHRSYFSFYYIICILYLWRFTFKSDYLFIFMNKRWFKLIASILMISVIFLAQSKAAFFSLMIILIHFVIKSFVSNTSKILTFGVSLSLLLLTLLVPALNKRMVKMYDSITNIKTLDDLKKSTTHGTSSGARLQLYYSSIQLIKKSPLIGYGTGDIKEVLNNQNLKNEFLYLGKANAHSQFLNTSVALGFIGLISLLFIFWASFFEAFKNGNWFAFVVLLLIFFNCLPESWFEQQAGIVSSVFLFCLLPFLKDNDIIFS